jgi:hypothetical protein
MLTVFSDFSGDRSMRFSPLIIEKIRGRPRRRQRSHSPHCRHPWAAEQRCEQARRLQLFLSTRDAPTPILRQTIIRRSLAWPAPALDRTGKCLPRPIRSARKTRVTPRNHVESSFPAMLDEKSFAFKDEYSSISC